MNPADFTTDVDELLKKAVLSFSEWAAENWSITAAEAATLTKPTASPPEYARGYNDALASLGDAASLWVEGDTP